MLETLQEQTIIWIFGLLNTVILALVSWGLAYVKSKVKSDNVRNALSELQTAVEATVGELQNNLVSDWKKCSTDGKLTPEQIGELKSKYAQLINARMSASSAKLLQAEYHDLQSYIDGLVDAQINKIKVSRAKLEAGSSSLLNGKAE